MRAIQFPYSRDSELSDVCLNNANLMGRIAFFWKHRLVPIKPLLKECESFYVVLFEKMVEIPYILDLNRSGAELMEENPLARELYLHLKNANTRDIS